MATVGREFVGFVEEYNLVKMVISMLISRSISDFSKNLIDQFVNPMTTKFMKKGQIDEVKAPRFLGSEIDVQEIINRGLNVMFSFVLAFIIYQFL